MGSRCESSRRRRERTMHSFRQLSSCRYTRRNALALAVGTLAGCSKPVPDSIAAQVSIHRFNSYSQDLYEGVRRIFELHRVSLAGKRVVLKPNLVEFEPESVINTNPLIVHSVFEAAKAMGAKDVRIAEGPGHRRTT